MARYEETLQVLQSDAIFYDDKPQSDDILWRNNYQVQQFREQVTRMIIQGQPTALTIAIHGKWGSGKTSLWLQIKELLEQESRKNSGEGVSLCLVEISVDTYRQRGDTERNFFTHLVREIVLNIDNSLRQRLFTQLGLDEKNTSGNRVQPSGFPANQEGEIARFLRKTDFEAVVGEVFSNIIRFRRFLEAEVKGTGSAPPANRRIVICIDDLDRCSPSYVSEVVRTLRFFHEIPYVYVFLLVDEDILRDAFRIWIEEYASARSHFVSVPTTDAALERYISVVFHLPTMSVQSAFEYALQLVGGRIPSDIIANQIMPYIVDLIPTDRLTPRGIKRTLNQFSASAPTYELTDVKLLKQRAKVAVLTQYYKPVAKILRENRELFGEIEKAFYGYDGADLQTEIRHIIDKNIRNYRVSPEAQEQLLHDFDLWQILKTPPYICLEQPRQLELPSPIQSPREDETSPSRPDEQGGESLSDSFSVDSRETTVASLLPEAAAALLTRNEASIDTVLRKIMGIASTKTDAPYLAAIAQVARQVGLPRYALPLFQKALELDQNHEDILQAYVALVLDERMEVHYEHADECVERLLNDSQVPKEDLAFTLSLAVQLAVIRGRDYNDHLQQLLELWQHYQNINLYRRIMLALNAVKSVDERKALRYFCPVYRDSQNIFSIDTDVYLTKRATADFLAGMRNPTCEYQAMDLYRDMLEGRIPIDEDDRADIMHNYATLLYKHDYDAVAGDIWYDAYSKKPTDLNIRRAFMAYLLRHGAPNLAQMVLRGESFPKERLPRVSPKSLPPRFANREICENDNETDS